MIVFINLKINAAKGAFFDRKKVTSATDRATRQVLSRFGAFVRRSAKGLIRSAKRKVSDPGEPPKSKTGLLKKFILFAYDPGQKRVIIGPALLNQKRTMGPPVPELLEKGGTATRQFFVISETRTPSGRRRKNPKTKLRFSRKAPRRRVRYEPRPYMGPAFTKERPKIPQMWRDAITP